MDTDPTWAPSPARPNLTARSVHAWRVALDRPSGDTSGLSDDERSRADRFRADSDRTRFVASHAALRAILGLYAACRPGDLTFRDGPHGKPGLASPTGTGIEFNLSHSGDLAVVAVARGRRVGVDVEAGRAVAEYEAIVARFFSPGERASFLDLPESIRSDAFFRIWTCKEAYIKAIGTGLLTALDSFSVAVDPREPMRLVEVVGDAAEAARWTIRDLDPGPGYAGAVMAEGADWELSRFEWIS